MPGGRNGAGELSGDMHVVKGTFQAVQLIWSRCGNYTDKQSEHWVFLWSLLLHPQNSSQLASAWKPLLLCSRLGAFAFPPMCLVFKPAHRLLLSPQRPVQPRLTVKTHCHSEKQGDAQSLQEEPTLSREKQAFSQQRCSSWLDVGSYSKAFPQRLLNPVLVTASLG